MLVATPPIALAGSWLHRSCDVALNIHLVGQPQSRPMCMHAGGHQEAKEAYEEAVTAIFVFQVEGHRHTQPRATKGKARWEMIEMWPMQVSCIKELHTRWCLYFPAQQDVGCQWLSLCSLSMTEVSQLHLCGFVKWQLQRQCLRTHSHQITKH